MLPTSWLINNLLRTQGDLSPADHRTTRNMLVADGMCVMAMVTLQGGVFLTAFALALGASNYEIGLLTTIVLLSQIMQLSGLQLLRKFPKRRALVVILCALSRLMWVFIILTPFLFLQAGMSFLLLWLIISALVGAMAGPAWNSLMRDIVPEDVRGRVFSRRLAFGTGLALVCTLLGGYFIDTWKAMFPDAGVYGYSLLFSVGLLFGIASLVAVWRLPETRMQTETDQSLWQVLAEPCRDGNFRHLLWFAGIWSFGINMAVPFFAVYMLERIGLSVFLVTVLTVVSQLSNMLFLGIWGRLADRFSNKPVLTASGFLFLVAIVGWCFTTMPEKHILTIPILVVIHALSGMAIAGVSIASGNIALKLSPRGNAHGYMTVFSLIASIGGAIAPIVAGVLADFFAQRELSFSINWSAPAGKLSVYAMNLKALDFVFVLAAVVGMSSLKRLSRVREEGDASEPKIMEELMSELAMPLRTMSTAIGVRRLIYLPLSVLRKSASMLV